MSELKEYKCPNCSGRLEFDTKSQQLKCPYCDGTFDPDIFNDGKEYELNNEKWTDSDYLVYNCRSCGGSIIADADTAASTCPYCDNPVVMVGNVSGSLKPKKIIPFKYDKEQAKEEYRKHLKGKILLPKAFRSEAAFDEIKGIYVPFWLFDGKANAKIWFDALRTHYHREGDYDVRITEYYKLFRSGSVEFSKVPVDASEKIDDELSQSVEPYNNKELKDFNDNYLAGYYADRYTVDAEESVRIADDRILNSTRQLFDSTTSAYENCRVSSSSINLEHGIQEYAMYPMWIMNVRYKDKKYVFAMNGQTGRFVGDLPIDTMKYRFIMIAVFLGITLLMGIIQLLFLRG